MVYGNGGADELSISGVNRVSHLHEGKVRTYEFDPAELGIAHASMQNLLGGAGPEENAAICAVVLSSEIHGPKRDAVLLNSAFALSSRMRRPPGRAGRGTAEFDSGAALHVLDAYVRMSQSLAVDRQTIMKPSKLDIAKYKGEVLEQIMNWKRQEVPRQMQEVPLAQVKAFATVAPPCARLHRRRPPPQHGVALIAEVRARPLQRADRARVESGPDRRRLCAQWRRCHLLSHRRQA